MPRGGPSFVRDPDESGLTSPPPPQFLMPSRFGADPMHHDQEKTDADLEAEIRQRRTFNTAEAIGRLAGPGAMKGASAISRQQQAENEIASWLQSHFEDATGALRTVIQRRLKGSEQLIARLDSPLNALFDYCAHVAASDYRLQEIVREADAEWGLRMEERPYFDQEGRAPHPSDPYTVGSVRGALERAVAQLSKESG